MRPASIELRQKRSCNRSSINQPHRGTIQRIRTTTCFQVRNDSNNEGNIQGMLFRDADHLLSPVWWQLLGPLVVAGQAVHTGLDQNQSELGVLHTICECCQSETAWDVQSPLTTEIYPEKQAKLQSSRYGQKPRIYEQTKKRTES
jgi:hypothetical protein